MPSVSSSNTSAKFMPPMCDILGSAQILSDLETRFSADVRAMQAALDAGRASNLKVRGENEQLRETLGSARREFEVSRMHERTQYLEQIRDLEARVQQTTAVHVPDADERCRRLQQTLTEQRLKQRMFQQENDDLRAKAASMLGDRDSAIRAAQRHETELKALIGELTAEKTHLQEHLERAQAESRLWVQKHKDASDAALLTQKDLNSLRYSSEERILHISGQLSSATTKEAVTRQELEKLQRECALQTDLLNRELNSLGDEHRFTCEASKDCETRLKEKCANLEMERDTAINSLTTAAEKFNRNFESLNSQISALKTHEANLRNDFAEKNSLLVQQIRKLRDDNESLMRKIGDHNEVRSCAEKREKTYQSELCFLHKKLQETTQELQIVRQSLTLQGPRYQEEHERCQRMHSELEDLRKKLKMEKDCAFTNLEHAKNAWSKTVLELSQSLDQAISDKERYQDMCAKVKKAAQRKIKQFENPEDVNSQIAEFFKGSKCAINNSNHL